ncbi:uncharacterized protein BO95DRAFT_482862 [Aspergillus brunneoviolaceus CBS 621.78]|uniref:Uncharacterized protein n=1 Tax=Aspergillus brunneoviolaceus CBS 621.78 TaxID=1450534 RepID=A0ACD1G6X8_9EURO|nr:hypothetical protein BO95DRAFT_482862 [Aspergillus brunneoviolaceus CBS 621.78]RAH44994.1 hypothetical protein BO95DRAFT_482862 [Aspergillus brunneoviolaceus CBS 621.78]
MSSVNYTATNIVTAPTTTSTSTHYPELVGWIPENSGRGTLSLLTSCLTTLFLCTWVVIHPRVHASMRHSFFHKVALFLKTLIAPEFIAVEGLQEWAQCRRMRRDFMILTSPEIKDPQHNNKQAQPFTLLHAFYISMLALRYRTPLGDRVLWPNQYVWLLQQGLIEWKDHTRWGLAVTDIEDKSKADAVAKLIALAQVLWFVAQCILRAVHGLPLAQLEAMTLGYIPLIAVTYFFWWHKPKDIRSPTVVELPVAMTSEQRAVFECLAVSHKFDNEGLRDQVTYWSIWYLTPRVFEKEERDRMMAERVLETKKSSSESPGSSGSSSSSLADPPTHVDFQTEGNKKEIVVAHWDPDIYRSKLWPLTCLFGMSFGALHLVSCNDVFPTTVELWLWRIAAFVSMGSMLVFMHFEKVVLRWEGL